MTEQQMLRSGTSDSSEPTEEIWRNEIQDRVARYRTRRGRRLEGTYSMRFSFDGEEETAKARQSAASVVADAAPEVNEPEIAASRPDFLEDIETARAPMMDLTVPKVERAASPEILLSPGATLEISSTEPVAAEPSLVADTELVLEGDPEPLPSPVARPAAKRKVIAFPRPASAPEEVYHRLADPVISGAAAHPRCS